MSLYVEKTDNIIRLSHIIDHRLHEVFIDDGSPVSGTLYVGKVAQKSCAKYWIDIGLPKVALLKKYNHDYVEGEKIVVELLTPPIPEKNLVKNAAVKPIIYNKSTSNLTIGTVLHAEVPELIEYIICHKNEAIHTNWSGLRALLRRYSKHDFNIIFNTPCKWKTEICSLWSELDDKVVALDCGGYIVINELDGLTAIDVNTTSSGNSNFHSVYQISSKEDILAFAKAALAESIRQINLRKIGGIILIDLPRMLSQRLQNNLLSYAKKYHNDTIQVLGFTRAGLLEITKARKQKSLQQILRYKDGNG